MIQGNARKKCLFLLLECIFGEQALFPIIVFGFLVKGFKEFQALLTQDPRNYRNRTFFVKRPEFTEIAVCAAAHYILISIDYSACST